MSGGSFNYLLYKEIDELFNNEDLRNMADALARVGYAPDAAAATNDLILELRAIELRVNASLDRLRPIWRAMEWWQSCDIGEDGFKRALAEYRGQ